MPDNYMAARISSMKLCRFSIGCALAAALAVCSVGQVQACLWFYGTNPHGHSKQFMGPLDEQDLAYEAHHQDSNRKQWEQNRKYYETTANLKDYQQLNDYAATLIRLGDAKPAIEILNSIEQKRPGDYATAANLGTAFELAGDNAQALKWIKEAIRRNPNSHAGTEWVHVRILETKLKTAQDPHWLETHTVLGLDFGPDIVPRQPPPIVDDLGKQYDFESVQYAIDHQLHERIALVPPPDWIVGDLLASLGNLIVLNGVLEQALTTYDLALEYQAPQRDLVRQRIEHFKRLIAANPDSLRPRGIVDQERTAALLALAIKIGAILIGAVLVVASLVFFRRRRQMNAG